MFNLEYLPLNTKNVFNVLSKQKFMQDYTLVGGTALAMQIEHRKSEDLDFVFDGEEINTKNIKRSINAVFSKYKIINEEKNYQVDFIINEVKVTFFSTGAALVPFNIQEHSSKLGKIYIAKPAIIGVLKLITISQRNTIRDYYDLYFITKKVIGIEKLFEIAKIKAPNISPIIYSETLIFTDDLEENSIGEHLEPAEILSKEMIADYFVSELKKIKEKI
ncbi:MAG: nucleotidyl transferase AbiEii/AbiGii toxin family protein [Ignavibacteriae bacterium]|nr:nucleotidyl transferase AbiEii/AbiGii toxin family protein [Ignavibacteriota bacterium]